MARKIKISAGILNIRLNPHPEGVYLDFIVKAYSLRSLIQIFGDRYGIISSIDKSKVREGLIFGSITTFTKIEFDGSWFDASTLSEATDKAISTITIPENIFPNAASFYFAMDSNTHRIYIQEYSLGKMLTLASSLRFFKRLASNTRLIEKFGPARITLIQTRLSLDDIFNLKRIDEINITIFKPNPDIFSDDFEAKIEKHLAEAHSNSISVKYNADSGDSLKAIPEIRSISEVALDNGSVQVRGRDDIGAVTKSTQRFPQKLHDKYGPEKTIEIQAFRRMIKK